MNNKLKSFVAAALIVIAGCIKQYNPPVLQLKNNYLVVDGFINTGADATTTITLSRTRNLTDTAVKDDPETNASVQIISENGSSYTLMEKENGVYQSAMLNLNDAQKYKLTIQLSNGNKYSSAFEAGNPTPQIDSLNWQQPGDLNIYLYTHDDNSNVRYYKWDYIETWQYNTPLSSPWGVKDGLIFVKPVGYQVDSCWQSDSSTDVLIASTVNLSDDKVSQQKIATVPKDDEKLYTRYSVLVRQRAITAAAYKYWDILKKNSQDRGSFFDLQPGQLVGNIIPETDATEPVIGYINCSSQTEKRIFVKHDQVDWKDQGDMCPTFEQPVNPDNFLIFEPDETLFAPYYFISNGPLVVADAECVDCTKHGGTTDRPSFW